MSGIGGEVLLLALARAAFVAALLSAFGASLFVRLVAPRADRLLEARHAATLESRYLRLVAGSLGAAFFALVVWLGLEAAAMAEASTLNEALNAVPEVLFGTSFGHVLLAQGLVLAAALFLALRHRQLSRNGVPVLAGIAVMLEALHSHAYAMASGPSLLVMSQALHLLAAGAWLGGLAPLLLLISYAEPPTAAAALRRFSNLAAIYVVAVAATAFVQASQLAGGLAGLTGTAYGRVLMLKTALFLGLLGLAALNRFRLTPALSGQVGGAARRQLMASIAMETALGLLIVVAAGVLSGLEPGMHGMGDGVALTIR